MPIYLVLVGMFSVCWSVLFLLRKDLRFQMLISSIGVWPFAFYDYFSRPSYWNPQTLLNIPIGIEGFLFAFFFSGIAAVLYEELSGKHLRKRKESSYRQLTHWIAPSTVVIVSLFLFFAFRINMMVALVIGLGVGSFLIALIRQDLIPLIIGSGLAFGILYTLLLSIWFVIFPEALTWWNLKIFWGVTVGNVPLGEVLFGFVYGAFWGPIYEFLFGFRLTTK